MLERRALVESAVQLQEAVDQIRVGEDIVVEVGRNLEVDRALHRRDCGRAQVERAVAPAPASCHAAGMRLVRIEGEQAGRLCLLGPSAALELGSTDLGYGDHQRFVPVRRVVVTGEIRRKATQARDGRIAPEAGRVAGVDASHGRPFRPVSLSQIIEARYCSRERATMAARFALRGRLP